VDLPRYYPRITDTAQVLNSTSRWGGLPGVGVIAIYASENKVLQKLDCRVDDGLTAGTDCECPVKAKREIDRKKRDTRHKANSREILK
jgi:hypothetical protein